MAEKSGTSSRLTITVAMAAAGLLLVAAGLCRSVQVKNLPEKDFAEKPSNYSPMLALSEPAMMLDVTIGGLNRLSSGDIQRTYGGDVKAAGRCPT